MIFGRARNDLFQMRMKLAMDFIECSDHFNDDVCQYLKSHSAGFRRVHDDRKKLHELLMLDMSTADGLLDIFCTVSDLVMECFWAIGMMAAVQAATAPGFDVTVFLKEHSESYKTPEYLRAVEKWDAAYEAAAVGDYQQRDYLRLERLAAEDMIKYQAAVSAVHGFEWTLEAQEKAGISVEQSHIDALYRFFSESL